VSFLHFFEATLLLRWRFEGWFVRGRDFCAGRYAPAFRFWRVRVVFPWQALPAPVTVLLSIPFSVLYDGRALGSWDGVTVSAMALAANVIVRLEFHTGIACAFVVPASRRNRPVLAICFAASSWSRARAT
jgi:hypothetical protein